jgi:prepilin peptidase CpaA
LIASAVIELKRKTAASVDTYVSDALDIAGSGAAGPARHTFVVGGRRATPYAALLAVSAIGSLTLQVFEAAR